MATSTISNTILGPNGTVVAGALVVAKLMPTAGFRIDTFTEVARTVSTTTNASGFWSLALERQANINPANTTWYEVTEHIPDVQGGVRVWNISVGASNQNLYASLVTPSYAQPIIISSDQATYLTQQSADARYQALGSLGSGTPATIEPDDAGSGGVSTSASRADHEHPTAAAAPSANVKFPVSPTTNSEGVSTSFSRADHGHAVTFNPPSCRVYHNATQAVASGANVVMAFNSEIYDNDTMHDLVTNNSRITFTTAGVYVVTANFQLDADAGGDWVVSFGFIRKNGTDVLANNMQGALGAIAFGPAITVTTIAKFAATDYVELLVSQTNGSGAGHNVEASNATTLQQKCSFQAAWVGVG